MTFPSRAGLAISLVALMATSLPAQFPDLIYYQFDEGGGSMTLNAASPQVGSPVAAVNGGLTLSPTGGQFNGGLLGAGGTGSTDFVDTGWVTNLPGDFTISFWLDLSNVTAVNPFMYVFGDNTANSLRIFTNGAAGTQGIILRQSGGLTDTIIPGGANQSGPQAVAWVYDSTVPEIRGFLNGVQVANVGQPSFTIAGSANLKVGAYSSSSGLAAGAVMDEFRMYNYALTAAEISATWSTPVQNTNILTVAQTGPGVGDLFISLTQTSPTATEGWTLISADTSGFKGTGSFFGIEPDALTWALLFTSGIADGNLFHFPVPSPTGAWPNTGYFLPPGSVSSLAGLTLDFGVVLVSTGLVYDGKSNVERLFFQ